MDILQEITEYLEHAEPHSTLNSTRVVALLREARNEIEALRRQLAPSKVHDIAGI